MLMTMAMMNTGNSSRQCNFFFFDGEKQSVFCLYREERSGKEGVVKRVSVEGTWYSCVLLVPRTLLGSGTRYSAGSNPVV